MKDSKISLCSKIKALLERQKLGVLATQGGLYPHTSLVAFTFTKDLRFIIFSTMSHTRKYRNILKNPHVSVLIDSRRNYIRDLKEAVALTVTGGAVLTDDKKKVRYRRLYLKRFPHLKRFIDKPDTAIIIIEVTGYIFVQRFQEVLELRMK